MSPVSGAFAMAGQDERAGGESLEADVVSEDTLKVRAA